MTKQTSRRLSLLGERHIIYYLFAFQLPFELLSYYEKHETWKGLFHLGHLLRAPWAMDEFLRLKSTCKLRNAR